jgi:hypothetical protein
MKQIFRTQGETNSSKIKLVELLHHYSKMADRPSLREQLAQLVSCD